MNISKNTICSVALLAACATAQTISGVQSTSQSFGDSDAGATVSAYGSYFGQRSTGQVYVGSGRYQQIQNQERLVGYGYAHAAADVRLLGEQRRAGYFRLSLSVNADIRRTTSGSLISQTCNESGSVYLSVGGSVLWNWSLGTVFDDTRDLRIRIMVPTLGVPFGPGVVTARGDAFGRVNTQIRAVMLPCYGFAHMNGNARVSADAAFNVSAYSVFGSASVDGTFYCKDQRLELSNFFVRPNSSHPSNWVSGLVRLHMGAMRGHIKLGGVIFAFPFFIPYSTTIANWSKSDTVKTLFNE